ncbi:PEP-CTERM sorting domain-containing protein [Rubritalea spongiae]|uniref:PEP-CTERM sorting domain-containing protein n=1 Tax=Rubritalea spongiae TaxID=430797 RepID=A0ABW5E0J2_9BACT
MKRIPLTYTVALFTTSVTIANASVTVTAQAITNNGLADSTGADLAEDSLIRIGSFQSFSNAEIITKSLIELEADFIEFGSGVTGTGFAEGYGAHFDISITGVDSDALGINGDSIYVWAFNGETTNTSSEHAIFEFTETFPNNSDIPPSQSVSLETGGSFNTVIGVLDAGNTSNAGIGPLYLTQAITAVPEPSSTALLGLGSVAFLLRRRR